MTNPKYAQDTDNGRYYLHPTTGERWPSVTNILDTCVNKPALVPWAAKVTAEAFWEQMPTAVRASLRGEDAREAFLREIKKQVRYVRDTAANLGTRVHTHAEAYVVGNPAPDDPEVEPYAKQLVEWFADFGVNLERDVEAAEATIINRAHGYAGTGDLWVWLRLAPDLTWSPRKRHLWLVDYKTSATRAANSIYPEHGMQVAALAAAEALLLNDGTEVKPPGPIAGTAVLNLRTTTYAFMPVPADRKAALAGFVAALGATKYLHGLSGKPVALTAPTRAEKTGAA